METTPPVEIKHIRFTAGSASDPRPESNPLERRFARCLNCNLIVQFSRVVRKWTDDGGHFHTSHELETPKEWLPK